MKIYRANRFRDDRLQSRASLYLLGGQSIGWRLRLTLLGYRPNKSFTGTNPFGHEEPSRRWISFLQLMSWATSGTSRADHVTFTSTGRANSDFSTAGFLRPSFTTPSRRVWPPVTRGVESMCSIVSTVGGFYTIDRLQLVSSSRRLWLFH